MPIDRSMRTIALTGLLAASGALAQNAPPPAPVEVAPAISGEMAATVLAPGTVVSLHDAHVASEISGRLTWVAEVGTWIEVGGVIARVDDQSPRLALTNAEATVRRLEASITFQEKQLERQRQLASQHIAARNQVEEFEAQLEMSRQELVQARVARDQARLQLQRSAVTAPFAGQVVERLREAGEYISVGGEVARMVDTRNIEVRAQAPITVARHVDPGTTVEVRERGRMEAASVRTVIPVGDERSRMIELRVSLPPGEWLIGSAVRVALPNGESARVVAVPRDALILRQDAVFVFRVADDDTVEQVSVETGVGQGELVEVRGGISAGDRVVVRGGERLRPGQKIEILSVDPPADEVKVARAD